MAEQLWRREALAPYATLPWQSRGRLNARAGGALPQPVPARPRPHHPFDGVPAAEAQDAGLRLSRGRSLPDAAHPLARGGADRPHHLPHAAARRGSRRGGGARPRSRPHAVRPCRRGGAARGDEALWRLRPQRPDLAHPHQARGALCRVQRAQPHLGDARGRGEAQRAAAEGWPHAQRPAGRHRRILPGPRPRARRPCRAGGADRGAERRHRLQQPRHRRRPARRPVRDRRSDGAAAGRRDVLDRDPEISRHRPVAADPRGGAPRHQRHGRGRAGRDPAAAGRRGAQIGGRHPRPRPAGGGLLRRTWRRPTAR